jgi:ATF/CREB family transcription factor
LQQLQSGGATPSTIEFHRTALAAKKNSGNGPTSNANVPEPTSNPTMDQKPPNTATDFTQHDAADAANGLFMLAKGGQANNMQMNQAAVMQNESRSSAARRVSQNNGAGGREMSGDGSEQELSKPAGKGKGKKNAPKANAANNRRKADEPAKGPNKKAKMTESPSDDSEDEEMRNSNMDPKKMTDEEKRRNFLERNRYVTHAIATGCSHFVIHSANTNTVSLL